LPLAFAAGERFARVDFEGKEYLDFGGGIAVNVLGHAALTEILLEQASKLVHVSNLYSTNRKGAGEAAGGIGRHSGESILL